MSKLFLHKPVSAHSETTYHIYLHNSQHELLYCLDGKFSYTFKNRVYICRMYEFIIVPPNISIDVFESEAKCLHWQFDFVDIYEINQIIPRCDNSVYTIKDLLLLMLEEKNKNNSLNYNKECLASYEVILLLRLMHPLQQPDYASLKLPPHLDFVISYFNEHYNKKINIPVLFEKTGYSYNHIRHLFKNYFHIYSKQYLTQVRLEHARKLILNTDLSLREIALKCGFECVTLLNSSFKKKYFKTPLEYRLEQKG